MDDYYKCRLCLEESNRNINIFKEENFSHMIELLTGLKVDPGDGLPTNSCLQCHNEVKSAMLTRYQIINSYKILLDELQEYLTNDTKPQSFGLDVPNKTKAISKNKKQKKVKSKHDESSRLVESRRNNINDVENKTTEHLGSKNIEIIDKYENDDATNDGYNFGEDSEEGEQTNNSDSKKTRVSSRKVSETTTNFAEAEKQEFDKLLIKLRKRNKAVDKDIKFRRKRGHSEKSRKKSIQFRKKSSSDPYHVKVDYNIKPEHVELLKSIGKKDRVACPICQREMFGMNLKNHLITHNYDPVICDTCGKTSKNAQALQDHINYYHKTTPDRFMCDKCGKGYRVRFMLERHEKKEHGDGEKDYECTVCGKKFFEKLQLKNHINITHNKIKPFKCEHCGKDFGRRTQFVTHQLVHTKENRYHCQVCGKGFKIKQTMQTHLKGVHGIEEEKTIFCKICQKGFSSAQGLRAHINSRVHGLEKCEHCSEFITLEYKDTHLRDIHGIETKNSGDLRVEMLYEYV